MVDIIHIVPINGKEEDIYKAVTTKKGLSSWWTTDVKAQAKVGTTSEFGFMNHGMVFTMEVSELEPASRVKWISKSGPPDWEGTTVEFSLLKNDQGSLLRFVHAGFKSTDGGYGMYNFNWAGYLTSLKKYLETGKGEPNIS